MLTRPKLIAPFQIGRGISRNRLPHRYAGRLVFAELQRGAPDAATALAFDLGAHPWRRRRRRLARYTSGGGKAHGNRNRGELRDSHTVVASNDDASNEPLCRGVVRGRAVAWRRLACA